MLNIKQYFLPKTEWVEEKAEKKQIILHHTVSSTVQSVINWWINDGVKVSAAYIVDKDGTVYNLFDPIYWSYHIGKGSTILSNKISIGIEIVNEGALTKNLNNQFVYMDKILYKDNNDSIYEHNTIWRGYKYFVKYTENQYKSLACLLKYLINRFNIKNNILTTLEYDKDYFNFEGILSHRNLRPDKTDVSPAFDFNKLKFYLSKNF